MSRTLVRRAAMLATAVAALAALSTADAQAQAWDGTFKGSFVTDGPSGTMTLTFKKDGEAWKVANLMEAEGAPPASEPRDLKLEGSTFKFAQTFGDIDVMFQGTIDGDTIKGTLEAYQGGALIGSGSFDLKKQQV